MSRIALINLVPGNDAANYLGFNHGIGSISAVLKREGHATRLFTFASSEVSRDPLSEFGPDALFVYLATNQYRLFKRLLETSWRPMTVPVFAGGPHPTCAPEDTARIPGVTGVCVGEGEETARAIAAGVDAGRLLLDGIPNLCFEREGKISWGPKMPAVSDLDELPFPDRDIYPYDAMLKERAIRLMGFEVLCSRGCVYGCRYCINPLLRRINGRVRRRSVSNVIEELGRIKTRYNYEGIIGFHDDIFTLDAEWLEELSDVYARKIGLPFWCNAHVAELDERRVKALERAGCFRVHMGIECGDEATRGELLGKRISNDEIMVSVDMLKAHRMKIVTTFMIGLPDEKEDDIIQSIDLCRAIRPDWVLLSTFCPYPGTSLYRKLVSEGRLDPRFYETLPETSFYSSALTYDQGRLSQETVTYYFERFRKMAGARG